MAREYEMGGAAELSAGYARCVKCAGIFGQAFISDGWCVACQWERRAPGKDAGQVLQKQLPPRHSRDPAPAPMPLPPFHAPAQNAEGGRRRKRKRKRRRRKRSG